MNNRHRNGSALGLVIVAAFAVALIGGCKKADSRMIGTWTDPQGTVVTFNADNTFSQGSGATSANGKWSISDKKVTLNLEKIGGKPIDEAIDNIQKMLSAKSPQAVTPDQMAKLKAHMKAISFTLSENGKTMALDGSPNVTMTKNEAK
jgi:hypothetical protein